MSYDRAVLAGAAVREKLRTTTVTAVRGRAYDVAAHQQQAAMLEQLLAPPAADPEDDDRGAGGRATVGERPDSTAHAEGVAQRDVEALDLTDERLRHLQDAFTKSADRARETMSWYANPEDTTPPRPVREDDQRAHRPQQPDRHRGPEAGR
ncbi:hypothetical protein [Streptomyces sp. LN549]|uniref:hypothetical protein n=1 Tax=Streptomyces sp. LN549 TaxID=3112979 RepID=UPI003719BE8D